LITGRNAFSAVQSGGGGHCPLPDWTFHRERPLDAGGSSGLHPDLTGWRAVQGTVLPQCPGVRGRVELRSDSRAAV